MRDSVRGGPGGERMTRSVEQTGPQDELRVSALPTDESVSLLSALSHCVPSVLQVSFSEGGPGSNSTGSEVASMSSQLPDTPNSMVSSPIEA